jgi:hypothetical protein
LVRGIPVTTAARTAFDLGRRYGLTLAVIRLDALIQATDVKTVDIDVLIDRHRGPRGIFQLREAIGLADAGAAGDAHTPSPNRGGFTNRSARRSTCPIDSRPYRPRHGLGRLDGRRRIRRRAGGTSRLRGIDEQVAKAALAVAGLAPVKRKRFIALDGAVKSVNRELEARARDRAGLKGYRTNPAACPDDTPVTADFVIGSYHELWNIEKSFRMSKSDLRARPIYHRKRDSIEAHLTIVFAALAVTRFIEDRTGWSIRKFVRTARRYRTVQIRAGQHILTAEDPLPPDLREILALIK